MVDNDTAQHFYTRNQEILTPTIKEYSFFGL